MARRERLVYTQEELNEILQPTDPLPDDISDLTPRRASFLSPSSGILSFFTNNSFQRGLHRLSRVFSEPRKFRPHDFPDSVGSDESVSQEHWDNISSESDPETRAKGLKEIEEVLKTRIMNVTTVEALWHEMQDMMNDPELRDSLMQAMIELTQYQFEHISLPLRQTFFKAIKSAGCTELSLKWLIALTEDGTTSEGFETMMDDLVAEWLVTVEDEVTEDGESWLLTLLKFVHNYIRYNAAFISSENIVKIICHACIYAMEDDQVLANECLETLRTILILHHVQDTSPLKSIVTVTCRLVIYKDTYDKAFNLARTLLTSHFELRSLLLMFDILQTDANIDVEDRDMIIEAQRGVVYIFGNGCWGQMPFAIHVEISASTIIKNITKAVRKHYGLVNDMILAMRNMVAYHSKSLTTAGWTKFAEFFDVILVYFEDDDDFANACIDGISQVLTIMFNNYQCTRAQHLRDAVFTLLEKFTPLLPNENPLVLRLIEYRVSSLLPLSSCFGPKVNAILNEYLNPEQGPLRHEKVMVEVNKLYLKFRSTVEDTLLSKLLQPMLRYIEIVANDAIQQRMITLLLDALRSTSRDEILFYKTCTLFYSVVAETSLLPTETEDPFLYDAPAERPIAVCTRLRGVSDGNMITLLKGLMDVLREKWKSVTVAAIGLISEALIHHLYVQYSMGWIHSKGAEVRCCIFEFLLAIYSLPITNHLVFWSFHEDKMEENLLMRRQPIFPRGVTADPNNTLATEKGWSWDETCIICLFALKCEQNWSVVRTIIQRIGRIFEYPETVRTASRQHISQLVTFLTHFYKGSTSYNIDADGEKELNKYLPPILATLLNYTDEDEERYMICVSIISCAQYGSCEAILAADIAVQVVPTVMAGLAHELINVILSLHPTAVRAIPIMELMSDAAEIDDFHKFFSEDQFKSVCSILAPFTNVERFNAFIVSAMHRIMMRWFVRVPNEWKKEIRTHLESCIEKVKTGPFFVDGELQTSTMSSRHQSGDGRQIPGDVFMIGGSISHSSTSLQKIRAAAKCTEDQNNPAKLLYEIRRALEAFFKQPRIIDSQGVSAAPRELYELNEEHYAVSDAIITVRTLIEGPHAQWDARTHHDLRRNDSMECLRDKSLSSSDPHINSRVVNNAFPLIVDDTTRRRHRSAWSGDMSNNSSIDVPILRESMLGRRTRDDCYMAHRPLYRRRNVQLEEPTVNYTMLIVRHMYGKSSWLMRSLEQWPVNFKRVLSMAPEASALLQYVDTLEGARKLVPKNGEFPALQRALRVLDQKPAIENHAVGVIYIGPSQRGESDILANEHGSFRYAHFLRTLGELINLNSEPGGLMKGEHGEYTYQYTDEISQITFLVATLMPTDLKKDRDSNAKKKLIGNNFVTIVWNESGTPFRLGQFCKTFIQVALEVCPHDEYSLLVQVHAKTEIGCWLAMRRCLVTDPVVARLLRKLIVRTQLSVNVWMSMQDKNGEVFVSRGVDRLRKIQQISDKFSAYGEDDEQP